MRRTLACLALSALLVALTACSVTPIEHFYEPADPNLESGQLDVYFLEPYDGDPDDADEPGGMTVHNEPVRLFIDNRLVGTPVGEAELVLRPGTYTIGAVPMEATGPDPGKAEEIVIWPGARQELRFIFPK